MRFSVLHLLYLSVLCLFFLANNMLETYNLNTLLHMFTFLQQLTISRCLFLPREKINSYKFGFSSDQSFGCMKVTVGFQAD